MLDIKKIRENSKEIIDKLSLRGQDYSDSIIIAENLDEKWRGYLAESEELKSRKNKVSDEIGKIKREGGDAQDKITSMRDISAKVKELDEKTKKVKSELDRLMLQIPNIPDAGIARENRVVRQSGEVPEKDSSSLTHWDLGEMLNILDFSAASKLSGSRFALLKGQGALLERALAAFMLDIHLEMFSYKEVAPPYLVKEEIMVGTGQLPKFTEEMYALGNDDLYLIPTAEVPLLNIHRGEILHKENLPIKYVAHTPCFRREAGSYGRDVKGLIRNHQFNKVELVNIVLPEESPKIHEQLLKESEEVLKQLGLTYRVLELGASDMGFSATKTYDLEVWMPGEEKWREVSSCSNCLDFQSRRMGTRYRKDSGETGYVHTLNSSGLAVGRILAAVLENFQTDKINVKIPDKLAKYMKGIRVIEKE